MNTRLRPPALLLTLFFALSACGDGSDEPSSDVESTRPAGAAETSAGTAAVDRTAPGAATDRTGPDADRQPEPRREQETPARPAPDEDAPAEAAGEAPARPPSDEPSGAAAEEATTPTADEPTPRIRTAPAGTQIWATLLDSLDSEVTRPGDRFSAEVNAPITDGTYVLVPAGARLLGRVTQVRRARRDSAAVIALAFDSLRVREETMPLAATVTGVKLETRSEMEGEGRKIGIGAAAGAVIGAVVGKDVKGALIGAAGGAAVGTAVALGTQARYAVLPAGSEITLRLDEPLGVRLPNTEAGASPDRER